MRPSNSRYSAMRQSDSTHSSLFSAINPFPNPRPQGRKKATMQTTSIRRSSLIGSMLAAVAGMVGAKSRIGHIDNAATHFSSKHARNVRPKHRATGSKLEYAVAKGTVGLTKPIGPYGIPHLPKRGMSAKRR